MKMFVFEFVNQVSDRYHSDGGLMVVAENENHVKEMIKEDKHIQISDKEWEQVIIYELVKNEQPRIFVFPDAGCC